MNITDKVTSFEIESGIVSHHECINLDGTVNTKFKPYNYQYWTATKGDKTSPKYYAKGHAINWIKRTS